MLPLWRPKRIKLDILNLFNTASIETGFGFKSCKRLSKQYLWNLARFAAHGGFTGDVRRIRRRDTSVIKGTDTLRAKLDE